MADNKQRNVVMNLRSKDVVNGKPKLPTAEQLNFGEIAVNYAQGNETLSIKNNANQIVEFSNKVSSDYAKTVYPTSFEKIVSDNNLHIKGGDQLNSVAVKKIESTISSLANEVIENEETTAAITNKLAEGSGLIQPDGEIIYIPKEDAEYINKSKSLKEATEILDSIVKELKEEVIKDDEVSASSIIALSNAAGLLKTDGSIGFEKKENTNYIKNASSIYDALVILDAKIKEINGINNEIHLMLITTDSYNHDKALIPLTIKTLGVNDSVVWSHDLANDIATIDGTTLRFLKHYEGPVKIKATAGSYTDEKTITINCIQVPDKLTYEIVTPPSEKTVTWNDTSAELSFEGKIVANYSDGHKPTETTTSTYTFKATFPNGYQTATEYVDLGLPSGNLWAKCNIGAQKETDYGSYFQWGDTNGYQLAGAGTANKTVIKQGTYIWEGQAVPWTVLQQIQVSKNFSWSSYKYCNGSDDTLTKYNTSTSYGSNPDNKTTLESMDDAVSQIMGQGWSMPTKADFEELLDNTSKSWTTINGVKGYKFAKKNDSSVYIFIPAAGYGYNSSMESVGSYGCVWSSSLSTSYPGNAWYLDFNSGNCYMGNLSRYCGRSVRGVRRQ